MFFFFCVIQSFLFGGKLVLVNEVSQQCIFMGA